MKQLRIINSVIILVGTIVILSCSENKVKEIATVSTIDSTLQDFIKEELTGVINENSGNWGSVVVMDVNTGEIKAMINLRKDTSANLCIDDYNYAVYKLIEPGHMFSLASVMAGLEDNIVKLEDSVNTLEGSVEFYDVTIKDSHPGGLGNITLKKAFGKSSNVGISKVIMLAYKDSPEKFIDRIRQFDLDKTSGMKTENEPKPMITEPASEIWSMVSLPFLSIGYGVKLTPMQLLVFYNSIACNGKRIVPVLEKCDTVELPNVLNQSICSQSTLNNARELLDDISDSPLKAALGSVIFSGHSSIVSNVGDSFEDKNYTMITTAYFPSEIPEYSCIIVVNSNKGNYPNLTIPAFRDIMGFMMDNDVKRTQ